MPFKPVATPDDYPELESLRRPWDEWGAREQADNLREAMGDELFGWMEETGHDRMLP